jgi:hypothetical protein
MTRFRHALALSVLAAILGANGLLAGDRPFPYELKAKDFWLGPGGVGLFTLPGTSWAYRPFSSARSLLSCAASGPRR